MTVDQNLILEIYDTVVDPTQWPNVLDKIAQKIGARGCIIFNFEEDASGVGTLCASHLSTNYDAKAVAQYLQAFAVLEIEDQKIFARHSAAGDDIEAISDEVLAESQVALAGRANSKAMAEAGISYRAGALLSKDQPLRDRFSIQFPQKHGPLRASDRKILSQILPHMAKACEIARPVRELELRGSLLVESLNRLRLGVCLIRHDRSVIALNTEFRRQLEETRLFRVTPNGKLEPSGPRDQAWFAELTSSPTNHGKFGARPRKEALGAQLDEDRNLAVEVTPLRSQNAFGESRLDGYMVYSLDTSVPMELDIEIVEKVLGLTLSESALVNLMADGMTNRQIADIRDRSVDTVNSQVKGLLAKTNCANRTQLIRRASNIGAHFVI